MSRTLNEAIAEQVRRLRTERGWTQDRLAARLREAGFTGWSRGMVAALETRRRQVSVGDLISLCAALGVAPAELIGTRRTSVVLDDGSRVTLERAAKILEGAPGIRVQGRAPPRGTPSRQSAASAAMGELERRLARILGVTPEAVAAAAIRLWGRSATEERDRRAPDPGKLGVRRAASRGVRDEIEAAVARSARAIK